MKNKTTLLTLFTAFFLCMTPRAGIAQPIEGWAASRVHEALDRGLLVQSLDDNAGVYINWRQLKEDGPDPSYNVYVDRAGIPESYELLNTTAPITQTTDVVDPVGDLGDFYYVETINTGSISNAFSAYDTPYISIDVGGSFEKVGVGDLNGDGVMDFVIRTPAGSIDPNGDNWHDSTHTLKLKAFDGYTGAHMWTYDLGWNIEAGVWYSPFIVYDFDGNGKAEVAAKTGLTPQDDGANYVDYRDNQNGGTGQGRVDNPNGPEFLSIIDGETGNIVQRQPWPNREGLVKYNWRSRNQIAVAYLDGKTPFIIAQRGTYGVLKVQAYTFHNNQLTMDPSWYWDSTHEYPNLTLSQVNEGTGGQWIKQGAHSIRVGDVDGDDREEIILGACVLNDDLTGLWAKPSRYDQIDHTYLGELDPNNPGLELFMGAEYYPTDERGSQTMVNPATGAELWTSDPGPHHIHGVGIASDLDPDYDGVEFWGRDKEPNSSSPFNYFNAQGGPIEYESLLFNKSYDYHAVYWDADPQRELITAGAIFDRKSEVAITSVEWDIGNGETTISYPFNRGKTVWASDWNTSPGSNRVDFREGFESPGDPDYIEIVPVSGSDEWTMTWKGDPIFVTPQSTYFVTVNFKGIRDGVDFRMEILGNGVNIMPNAPSISVDGTGSGVTYLAVFTAPAGVTEIKPVLKGDGPSNYRYQINSIRIMEDNTPNRIRLTLAGTDRFWGDILGDWREEIITSYGNELRVYSTRVPAADRRVTYLQDPIYRADVAALAMGYAQVPTASTLPGFETASVGEEVILDNTDTDSGVSFQGTWTFSTQQSGRYGANYQHDGNTDKGNKSVTYTPTLSVAGHYEVFISTPTYSGWEDNVPVEITHADGVEQTTQDLTLSANYNQWVSFGSYNFTAGTAGNVLISNAGTNNHVIIDAVKFVYVGGYQEPPDGGETVSLGAVNYGVAAQDNATGTGYILWSATNVHTRFNPQQYNSDHMIAVKWTGSEWVYDTNEGYVSFTPQASDVLIAEVDFSNDTISSLEGVSGTYQGIELGYASGDLSFAANVWNGGSNAGEFTVSGTAFTKNGDGAGGDFFVFQSSDLSGYGGQDGINNQPTSASVSPDGSSLTISGNAWKKVPYNYTLTPNSVLEFTVYSSNVDEILAIGVDTNNVFNDTATTYMLAGSQTDLAWTLLNGGVYTEGDTVSFQIPIGQDLSGTISYLTFIADDDDQGAANGTFTDVRIRELPNTSIPIDATQLTDYHNQTTTGSTTVSADQLSLTLTGNTWRKMPYTYTVTADTILEVTIDASNTGEITGIGVDTDSDLTTGPKLLRLSGSTPHSRFNDITPLYIANSGAYVYEIPLGNYYTGPMNYLVFVADDDDNPSANVQFSNVRLYESP